MTARLAAARRAGLDAAIGHAIEAGLVVGAAVMVMQDGQLLYRREAGMADRELGVPVRFNTLFRLASMSKLIVSATALSLCDSGQLDLDTPLTRWLPAFRPALADGSVPAITVRQLLSHTAGLSYGFELGQDRRYADLGVSDGLDGNAISLQENLRRLAQAPLLFRPGSAWQYSLATDVLGGLLEMAADKPLPDLVAARVTRPLGMADTGFSVTDPARLAQPYMDAVDAVAPVPPAHGGEAVPDARQAGGGARVPLRMPEPAAIALDSGTLHLSPRRAFDSNAYRCAGAGMIGSAADYLLLLEALRCGGTGILRPASAALLVSNAIGELEVPSRGPGWGFGLGPLVLTDPVKAGSPLGAGSWMWGGVYGCHYWVDPAAGISLVALSNTAVAGLWGSYPDSLVDAISKPTEERG